MENTPMSKLHFLFIMLNMSQVNVVKKGVITGIITKLEFLKKRKEEQKIKRKEQKNLQRMQGKLYGAGKAVSDLNLTPMTPMGNVSMNLNNSRADAHFNGLELHSN
jgi:hypothetical protein